MKIAKLLQQKYYRQRFDGAPLFLGLGALAEMKNEARKGKTLTASSRLVYYADRRADWYIPQADLKRATDYFFKKAKSRRDIDVSPTISKKFLKKWENDEKIFLAHCLALRNKNLSQLNDKELIDELKKLFNIYINRFTSSSIIDHFALGSDHITADLILQELKKKKLEKKFVEYFSVLTAPTKQSFINEAEIDLLITAYEFKKNKDLVLIDKYQEKYFWIHNNYIDDHVLGAGYFLREIKKLINSRHNLLLKAGQIKNIPRQNKIKKKNLIKKIKLSRYLQTLLTISDDFCWWQDERKKSTFWLTHYASLFLAEIAKRTNYTVDELKYLLPSELLQIFHQPISKEIIKKRMKACVYIGLPNQHVLSVETRLIASIQKILNHPKTRQKKLFGLVASPGYARGKARICLGYKDTFNFKKGEVLIAVMTRPDYIEAIKKAEAIVTEEGGLTSHAALVARELGVPCLIAVANATTNFKNGDLMEVDCKNGYAQLLSSAPSTSSSS